VFASPKKPFVTLVNTFARAKKPFVTLMDGFIAVRMGDSSKRVADAARRVGHAELSVECAQRVCPDLQRAPRAVEQPIDDAGVRIAFFTRLTPSAMLLREPHDPGIGMLAQRIESTASTTIAGCSRKFPRRSPSRTSSR
jgi:hypothetical protein